MIFAFRKSKPKLGTDETLVVASHNTGKVSEIRALIAPFSIHVLSAAQAGIPEPEETGTTFAQNAELKARHAMEKTGLAALADDSGLVIPAIGGAPGVYSARWAGEGKNFNEAFARIQAEIASRMPLTSATDAYFACVLCLCVPKKGCTLFEGRVDGTLIFPPRGTNGFGYDPIFIPKGLDITFGEMDAVEKNRISHRARAFEKFVEYIKS